jgi:uncharacterized protein (DUF697 family)
MGETRGRVGDLNGIWPEELRRMWDGLSPQMRSQVTLGLVQLPGDLKGWRRLIDQAVDHLRTTLGGKHQVAIVGPANVGKSTLFNQLIRSRADQAAVSAVPGTTRHAQAADAGLFAVIDTSGAEAVSPAGEEDKRRALSAAGEADVLLVVLDASHGVRLPEVASRLGLSTEQVIPLSAREGKGVERVLLAVARTEPGIVAALGAALPAYRWKLSQAVIARTASTAAAIAVTPLPFIDFLPLVTIQSAMVLSLARIYAQRITLARARELLLTFGLGLLGRTLFYELSKLGGPPGWLVAAAVAAGTTFALGTGVATWFERGEHLSRQSLRAIGQTASQAVLARLRDLGRRRPGRITLRGRVGQALEDLPGTD